LHGVDTLVDLPVISRQLEIAALRPNDPCRSTGQVIFILQIRHREGRIVAIEACMRGKEGPATTSLRPGRQITLDESTKAFSE
jgi:hypothetical protein